VSIISVQLVAVATLSCIKGIYVEINRPGMRRRVLSTGALGLVKSAKAVC